LKLICTSGERLNESTFNLKRILLTTNKTDTILLSIKTKYVNKILDGSKQYEFRGWKLPKNIEYVFIYSSGVEKKIVAQFRIEKIIEDTPEKIWNLYQDKAGITKEEFFNYVYSFNYDKIYAIKIKDLKIFFQPILLTEVEKGFFAPQRFKYLSCNEIKIIEKGLLG
jgi:predicted transcriptional regulator